MNPTSIQRWPILLLSVLLLGANALFGQDQDDDVRPMFVQSKWQLVRDDSLKVVLTPTGMLDTVLAESHEASSDSLDPDQFYDSSNRVLALVGPYLSYEFSYSGSGGVHPIGGSYYRTIDLRSRHTLSVDSLFSSAEILASLLRDSVVTKHARSRVPSTLRAFVAGLDGGCEIAFRDMLVSYAIRSMDRDSVIVDFGLTHGCEVMRGNFTLITIVLPRHAMLTTFVGQ